MAKAGGIRMAVLLCFAAATAVMSFYPSSGASISAPAHRRAPTRDSVAAQPGSSEVDAASPMEDEEAVDPFAPRGWQAPPPPQEMAKAVAEAAPPPAPIVPPSPPPLPYKFMGLMNDGGEASQQTVYLSKGDQIVVVQGGETLDGTYKVLHVDATRIEFEHVPTGEKQVLNIAANDK